MTSSSSKHNSSGPHYRARHAVNPPASPGNGEDQGFRPMPPPQKNPIPDPSKSQSKTKGFVFITVDVKKREAAGTRRFIRSHVMRGKNTKKHAAPTAQNPAPPGLPAPGPGSGYAAEANPTRSEGNLPSPEPSAQQLTRLSGAAERSDADLACCELHVPAPRGQAHDLYFFKFAEDLSGNSRFLLHRLFVSIKETMYPIEWCFHSYPSQSNFFVYALHDPAYLSACLFVSSAVNDMAGARAWGSSGGGGGDGGGFSGKTQYLMRHTIDLLQEHLRDASKQLDDSTTAVVGSLALASDVIDDDASCRVHVLGLQRLVQMRGGLRRGFDGNKELQLKLLRVDLLWCIKTGSKSVLLPDIPDWSSSSDAFLPKYPLYRTRSPSRIRSLVRTVDPRLQIVFRDTREFAHTANTLLGSRTKLPPEVYTAAVLSIQHRLVSLRYGLGPGPEGILAEALRVGLVTFEMSVFLLTPSLRNSYGYLHDRLQGCIERLADKGGDGEEGIDDLLLWLFLMGAMTMFTAEEPWLLPLARRLLAGRGWEECVARMRDIMWVDAIHDLAGEQVFKTLQLQAAVA